MTSTNLIHDNRLQLEALRRMSVQPPYFEPDSERFWDDPYIAQQMLKAHLDPNIDAASRKPHTIDQIVAWIMAQTGLQPGARLLDLGCGPGLYSARFAELGLSVTGMDISENSLRYARTHDTRSTYILDNYLNLNAHESYDAAVLIYGDLCVLDDDERDTVLRNVYRALRPGAYFIFDVTTPPHHPADNMYWSVSMKEGFWKPTPYLLLQQTFDYAEHDTLLEQYIVIEESGAVSEYRIWTHNYTPETMQPVLERCGFELLSCYSDLLGTPYQPESEWLGLVTRKASV
ncbi:MAG: class I SAM-dependent methyltransferase [Anaerolineae bacterium]